MKRPPLTARRFWRVCGLSALMMSVCLALGLGLGAAGPAFSDLARLASGGGLGEVDRTILVQVRLPRVLLAALLGGALSTAGVAFQALLRNPLADPYVLGVSGGASIGGVTALALGLGGLLGGAGVPLAAFGGALGALILIERIATVGGRLTVYTVLLTGAIFNAFSGAVVLFIQSVASLEELHAVVFYLMGRIGSYPYRTLGLLAIVVMIAIALLALRSRDFNAISLGEEGAMQLGVNMERLKRETLVLGSVLTGVAVAIAGLIGFVGLIVPHMLRLWLGPDHRLLVPVSFMGGAAFLVLADLIARVAIAPGELPVGVVTALIGGPFFLWLLRRRGREHGFS